MKNERLKSMLCGLLMAAVVSMGMALPSWAVDKAGDVVSIRGKAMIERKAGKIDARIKDALLESDSVVTRDKARVKMLFRDDSVLTLGANSQLVIKKYLYSTESKRAESIYELADGRLRSVVGSSGFKVTTPTALAAARGTVFTVSYNVETGTTEITVFEGSVEVRNINDEVVGTEVVFAGQSTTVTGDKPPTPPMSADLMGGGFDDKGGLSGVEGGTEPERHILNELRDLAERSLKLSQPFEQEPLHASTKVFMNIQF